MDKYDHLVAQIATKMILVSHGNHHDIRHFQEVFAYASIICTLEGVNSEQSFNTRVAALLHDIACPFLREEKGYCDPHEQEDLGTGYATAFLMGFGLQDFYIRKIVHLVGIHHSWDKADSIEAQILMEADFIVNAQEQELDSQKVLDVRNKFFKTNSGIDLINDIFLLRKK